MKRVLLLSYILGTVISVKAQQTTGLDHYLVNQFFVNPAAAGLNGTNIFLDYRRQWSGFAGAPETQVLSIDGNIKRESMGLGFMVVNDQVNVLGSTSALATYSYRIKFDEGHFLRFGLSAGLNQNRILFSRVIAEDPDELLLFQNNQNATSFDGSGGLLYTLGKFQFGAAASHLFGGKFYYENNFQSNSLNFQNIRHYLINAQYRFDFKNDRWAVMPSVQLRTAQGIPPIYEGGVTGYYKNNAWLTFRYANKVGYTAALGGVIARNIIAGYSYTFSANGMTGYNQGTHDIILGFRINSKGNGVGLDPKELEELNKKNNELFEKADFLQNENDQLRKEMEEQKKLLKEAIYGMDSLKKNFGVNKEELEKLIKENSEKFNNLPDGENSKTNGDSKNGTDPNALENITPGKVYVVVGSVKKLEGAKLLQKIVKREYGEDTYVVQDDKQHWYFVYTKSFDKKEDAYKERDRAINMDTKDIFIGKPWYYISTK